MFIALGVKLALTEHSWRRRALAPDADTDEGMSMSEDNLRELLARVHEHLAKAGPIDQDSRALLATLVSDIERTLRRGGETAVAEAAESAPRLEALAVQLEAQHPALVQVLRQFIDLLAKAGI